MEKITPLLSIVMLLEAVVGLRLLLYNPRKSGFILAINLCLVGFIWISTTFFKFLIIGAWRFQQTESHTQKNNQHKLSENCPVDFEIPLGAGDYDLIGGGLTLCIGIEI